VANKAKKTACITHKIFTEPSEYLCLSHNVYRFSTFKTSFEIIWRPMGLTVKFGIFRYSRNTYNTHF